MESAYGTEELDGYIGERVEFTKIGAWQCAEGRLFEMI